MRTRLRVTGAVMALGSAFALLPLWAAHAEPAVGEVTVSLPARIVLDGSPVQVSVSTTGLDTKLNVVAVGLYAGDEVQAMGGVDAGGSGGIAPGTLAPGTVVGRATLATASCDDDAAGDDAATDHTAADRTAAEAATAADRCPVDAAGTRYRIVADLTRHDSAAAVAKYAAKVSLTAKRVGSKVRWRAHVRRYDGSGWTDWSSVSVRIGTRTLLTDERGVAAVTLQSLKAHAVTAAVAETGTVWAATSASVRSSAAPADGGSSAITASGLQHFKKAIAALSD